MGGFMQGYQDALVALLRQSQSVVLDALPFGVCWIGRDLEYRSANVAYGLAHAATPALLLGARVDRQLGEAWRCVETRVDLALEGETVDWCIAARWAGGFSAVRLIYTPVWSGGRVDSLVVCRLPTGTASVIAARDRRAAPPRRSLDTRPPPPRRICPAADARLRLVTPR